MSLEKEFHRPKVILPNSNENIPIEKEITKKKKVSPQINMDSSSSGEENERKELELERQADKHELDDQSSDDENEPKRLKKTKSTIPVQKRKKVKSHPIASNSEPNVLSLVNTTPQLQPPPQSTPIIANIQNDSIAEQHDSTYDQQQQQHSHQNVESQAEIAYRKKLDRISVEDNRISNMQEQRTVDNIQLFYNPQTKSIIFFTITTGKKWNIEYVYETLDPNCKHLEIKSTGVVPKFIEELESFSPDEMTPKYENALEQLKKLLEFGQKYLNTLVGIHKAFFKKNLPKNAKGNQNTNGLPMAEDGTMIVGAKRSLDSDGIPQMRAKKKKEEFQSINLPTLNSKTKTEPINLKKYIIMKESAKFEKMKTDSFVELAMQHNHILGILEMNEDECKNFYTTHHQQ
jgi:hypothetical protein